MIHISVNNLIPRNTARAFDRGFVAQQVREYGYGLGHSYLLTGEIAGAGADNEDCLIADTLRPLGRLTQTVIDQCHDTPSVAGCDHPLTRRGYYTGGVQYCERCGVKVAG